MNGGHNGPPTAPELCPSCGAAIYYRADYAAPGIGQSWRCVHGHAWARIGGEFFDPAAGAHLLAPEDVR